MSLVGVTITKILTEEGKPLHWWIDLIKLRFNTVEKPKMKTVSFGDLKSPTRTQIGFQTKQAASPTKWRFQVLGGCTVCFTMQLTYWLYLPIMQCSEITTGISLALLLACFIVVNIKLPYALSPMILGVFFFWNTVQLVFIQAHLIPHLFLSTLMVGFMVTVWEFVYNKYLVLR